MILSETLGAVRQITIDRPEKRNALDLAHYHALADALEAAGQDESVSVVLLAGRAPAFCAGVDVAVLQEANAGEAGAAIAAAAERLFTNLDRLPLPLLAAIDGLAVGLGVTLLGYVDLVLASPRARFQTPFSALGVAPEAGSSVLLPRRIGWQNAAWMLFSSGWIDAAEALESGLVWRLLPEKNFTATALDLAAQIAAQPRASLAATKQLLIGWRSADAGEARQRENTAFAKLLQERRPH